MEFQALVDLFLNFESVCLLAFTHVLHTQINGVMVPVSIRLNDLDILVRQLRRSFRFYATVGSLERELQFSMDRKSLQVIRAIVYNAGRLDLIDVERQFKVCLWPVA